MSIYQSLKNWLHIGLAKNQTKILIIEDNSICRKACELIISDVFNNTKINTCTDAESAISKLKLEKFDIVFVDLSLGEMNGIQMMQLLDKSIKKETIFIALTSYGDTFIKMACKSVGISSIVEKPISKKRLEKVLNDLKFKKHN